MTPKYYIGVSYTKHIGLVSNLVWHGRMVIFFKNSKNKHRMHLILYLLLLFLIFLFSHQNRIYLMDKMEWPIELKSILHAPIRKSAYRRRLTIDKYFISNWLVVWYFRGPIQMHSYLCKGKSKMQQMSLACSIYILHSAYIRSIWKHGE